MVLLVAGSRDYCDYDEFKQVMDYTHNKYHIDKIVSGAQEAPTHLQKDMLKKIIFQLKYFQPNGVFMVKQQVLFVMQICTII